MKSEHYCVDEKSTEIVSVQAHVQHKRVFPAKLEQVKKKIYIWGWNIRFHPTNPNTPCHPRNYQCWLTDLQSDLMSFKTLPYHDQLHSSIKLKVWCQMQAKQG